MAAPKLPHYEVLEPLGQGAAAVVYRARDVRLGRDVALKVLNHRAGNDPALRRRFDHEARALAATDHPNVVTVYEIGEVDGTPYIALELVDGRTLAAVFAEGGHDRRTLVGLVEQAARGVGAAHDRNIVHRDLKPSNILVTRGGIAKVADFGIAHLADSNSVVTRVGMSLGTPLYMSPEQAQGRSNDVTPRSDVYSLGVILYEALTGRRPHDAPSLVEVYHKIVGEEPVRLRALRPDIDPGIEAVCLKALAKDPESRYATAREFAEEVRRWLAGESPHALARRTRRHKATPAPSRPRPTWAMLGGGAFVAVALVGAVFASRGRPVRSSASDGQAASKPADTPNPPEVSAPEAADPVNPAAAKAWLDKGLARARAGDLDGAIADFTRAIEIDPRNAIAYASRGLARDEKRDWDGAIEDYTRAIELDPRNATTFNNRGWSRSEKGDLDGAIADFTHAIELNPGYAKAYVNRSWARNERRDWDGAIADCARVIELNPRSATAYGNRGWARVQKGDLDGAIADLEKALEVAPPDWPQRAAVEAELRRLKSQR